jgi:hypothetical protein
MCTTRSDDLVLDAFEEGTQDDDEGNRELT